jgi:hypothetical protein
VVKVKEMSIESPKTVPKGPGNCPEKDWIAFELNRRVVRADLTEDRKVGGKMALHRLSPQPFRPGMK